MTFEYSTYICIYLYNEYKVKVIERKQEKQIGNTKAVVERTAGSCSRPWWRDGDSVFQGSMRSHSTRLEGGNTTAPVEHTNNNNTMPRPPTGSRCADEVLSPRNTEKNTHTRTQCDAQYNKYCVCCSLAAAFESRPLYCALLLIARLAVKSHIFFLAPSAATIYYIIFKYAGISYHSLLRSHTLPPHHPCRLSAHIV